MYEQRSIDDIVETLRNAKDRGRGCTVLIGAGCSVEAGIPTAAGFVDVIKQRYPRAYERAEAKTYPKCMAQLNLAERRDLIAQYVDRAKINWAHVCIAILMQEGYINRVLTTNFDLLVVRSCALLNEFPAVYDFAASQLFKAADIPGKAVFYLHGQYTGFVLINTEEDFKKHSELLGPVFEDAGRGRVWLVVGYSGENDPVFDHLAGVPCFDNGLYWINHSDAEPPKHVRDRLLLPGKAAFYTGGFDADSFFITLAQRLGIFPPRLIAQPFSHLNAIMEMLAPYTLPLQTSGEDVTEIPRKRIRSAIRMFEARPSAEGTHAHVDLDVIKPSLASEIAALVLLMAGDYDHVLKFRQEYDKSPTPELAHSLTWAYVSQGNTLGKQARTKTGEEADRLYALAGEKFQAALAIKPDMHEALNNWGVALTNQARTKTGEEADRLYALAGEKFQAALAIKPEMHEALTNWGVALGGQASTKTGEEAHRLYALAGEKYQAALAIKPDMHEALNNWGAALGSQARTKTGEEADRLYALAGEKYQAALAIKPDNDEALNNWGAALGNQARTKTGEEADRLYALAGEKYQAALAIKPDDHEALNNWGAALGSQARTKTGEEADRLHALAGEKYQAALAIKPDDHEALNNWGSTLLFQVRSAQGESAKQLLSRAREKLLQAESIRPGAGAYNLACLSALQRDEKGSRAWLEKSRSEGQLPSRQHLVEDSDLDSVRESKWFKEFLSQL